jgi:hypothetical protein
VRGAAAYLDLSARLANNTFTTIRYLSADKQSDPQGDIPRLEYALSVAPLNRAILDTVMTVVFMLEDLPARWEQFAKAGWRDMKREHSQVKTYFGGLPAWQTYLAEHYEVGLANLQASLGITEEEAENLTAWNKFRWPNPGQMVRHKIPQGAVLPPSRQLLEALDAVLYADLSQQAHISWLGGAKRPGFLAPESAKAALGITDESLEAYLAGYRSDQVFIAVTLLLVLVSVLDEAFGFGLDARTRYIWAIVKNYWDPAELLYEIRYAKRLFAMDPEQT